MRKWKEIYWNDLKRFVRDWGFVIVTVIIINVLLGCMMVLNNKKDAYIQELEQYVKVLEDEQLELLETTQLMEEAYDALEDENQILGSYIAQHEIQYEQ